MIALKKEFVLRLQKLVRVLILKLKDRKISKGKKNKWIKEQKV